MNRETMEKIDACLNGSISEQDFRALQDEMRMDSTALDHWCRQSELHGRLEWELSPRENAIGFPSPRKRLLPQFAAAAALLLLGTGLGFLLKPHSTPEVAALATPPPLQAPIVARLSASDGAVWSSGRLTPGEWIPAGALDLVKGNALITFDCGASVQLTAPVRLHLMSTTRALLETGAAEVRIPRQAYGFVFETPSVEISERMSRFHAFVNSNGHTDLRVSDGQVRVSGKIGDINNINLGKERGVRIDSSGSFLPLAETADFRIPAALPESADLLPEWFLHWGFDSADSAAGEFGETGIHPELPAPFTAQARSAHPDADISLVAGRFGNAIQLNGQFAFLATRFPGFSGNSPRSIAFWVKIAPDTPDTLSYSMLSWGTTNHLPGGKWQLSWNTGNDNPGTRGAIRTEVEGGYQIGSTNLLTGTWHHVVSVYAGGQNGDIADSIRHYVDGRLESATALKHHLVDTQTEGPQTLPVAIGRRLDSAAFVRSFCGSLDEIYLFPCALTPQQVERLFRENRPPQVRE